MSKHGFDISQFKTCHRHGHFAGNFCPLCEDAPAPETAVPEEQPDPFASERETWWKGPETELHDHFEKWLRFHEVEYIHSRTDQKSTIESGWPDFSCFRHTSGTGNVVSCFIEFKNRTGKLRKDQIEVIDRLQSRNIPVLVTGNFDVAIAFVKSNLCMQ